MRIFRSAPTSSPALTPVDEQYPAVDVCLVMESTYPYLKGGVSAVVHDIVLGNPDVVFGVVHITWDRSSPHEDLYGLPPNVSWVMPVYLSMQEHQEDFLALRPESLQMSARRRRVAVARLFDALDAIPTGDPGPFWSLYDDTMNPRTRDYPLWALLGTQELMEAVPHRLPGLGMSLTDTFWQLREFFSLAAAVLGTDLPRARVYHAHTTGYAALIGAAGARMHRTSFLLTEHNLYVRDTVNTRLDRNMSLRVTLDDYRTFEGITPADRAWMAWWIEMGRLTYPSADVITYLYPAAVEEARALGGLPERSVVIPNGMTMAEFDDVFTRRQQAVREIERGEPGRLWRLVYIARVVPIKGLLDLIDAVQLLRERGVGPLRVDVLGPTDHTPEYYAQCVAKIERLGLQDSFDLLGTVKVRELLGDYDVLVLPSYNEGQPIVVLECMTAGIPTVGTEVGGMAQLVDEQLTTREGVTIGPAGLLTRPGDPRQMADRLQELMSSPELYVELSRNARARVQGFFQLADVVGAYDDLYRRLGRMRPRHGQDDRGAVIGAMPDLAADPDGVPGRSQRALDRVARVAQDGQHEQHEQLGELGAPPAAAGADARGPATLTGTGGGRRPVGR